MEQISVNQRVKFLIEEKLRMNKSAFATSIGKPASSIQAITDGQSKPGFEMLQLIAETHNVNMNWLITGKGEVLNPTQAEQQLSSDVLSLLKAQFESMKNDLDVYRAIVAQQMGIGKAGGSFNTLSSEASKEGKVMPLYKVADTLVAENGQVYFDLADGSKKTGS